jgi:hypothetical protein
MRYAINFTLAASLVAGAAAHQHGHQHFHARNQASPVEQRNEPEGVKWVPGAVETVYELNGEVLKAEEAKKGLDGGNFVVVGETMPTVAPPPPPPAPKPKPKPKTSKEADLGAQFIEQETSSPPAPKPTVAPPKPKPSPPKEDGGSQGGQGLDTPFPSGKVKCSEFPSSYGAVALDWLDLGGWSGLQFVPDFSKDDLSISNIITGIAGETCDESCMCSYACPPGYRKTQFPKAQGATKQSIGGLYCNSEGYLELTRPEHGTLCEKGAGGVSIQNDLDEVVSTCETDYPGTESMVIPSVAEPGSTVELNNPDQTGGFLWDGMAISAQYYINPKGFTKEEGCVWNSEKGPDRAGNWACVIAGVGRAEDGLTYLSIFQNAPTSDCKLDFNIEIKGDVNSKCAYMNGQWIGGGDGEEGCTVSLIQLLLLLFPP